MATAERLYSKFHSSPRSSASRQTDNFIGLSFSLGHYPYYYYYYQPPEGVYLLNIQLDN